MPEPKASRETLNRRHESIAQHGLIAFVQKMANLFYNDRLIIAYASFQQSSKLWTAGAEITWKADGQRYSHTIDALPDRFKTAEEAERFIINFAKSWIDGNP